MFRYFLKNSDELILASSASFLIFLLSFALLSGITHALSTINEKDIKVTKNLEVKYISSLNVDSSTFGSFFLGCGHIDNKNYYYYILNSKYGYQITKLEVDDKTYIKEDCDTKPFIEYVKYKAVSINWFGKLFYNLKDFDHTDNEIIFHVPKNTIIKNYYVDIDKL